MLGGIWIDCGEVEERKKKTSKECLAIWFTSTEVEQLGICQLFQGQLAVQLLATNFVSQFMSYLTLHTCQTTSRNPVFQFM